IDSPSESRENHNSGTMFSHSQGQLQTGRRSKASLGFPGSFRLHGMSFRKGVDGPKMFTDACKLGYEGVCRKMRAAFE
ncbi:hypothetical protein, partial [Bradyrhizobium sp. Mp64]